MPFKPGQSGNPGGRSKVVQYHLEKFRNDRDLKAFRDVLRDIALDVGAENRDRLAAIKEWHDRAYGKAPQAITGEDGGAVKVDTSAGLLETLKKLAGEK